MLGGGIKALPVLHDQKDQSKEPTSAYGEKGQFVVTCRDEDGSSGDGFWKAYLVEIMEIPGTCWSNGLISFRWNMVKFSSCSNSRKEFPTMSWKAP